MSENCMPMREKYWSELDVDEKIERIRKEVKALMSSRTNFFNRINELEEHSHDKMGDVVVKIHGRYGGSESLGKIGQYDDDVYF